MPYYLSVDGGGTKVAAILFDEEYRCIGTGIGGAVNSLFNSTEAFQEHIRTCLDQCFAGCSGLEIDKLYLNILGPAELFIQTLNEYVKLNEMHYVGEGKMGVLAGILSMDGIVAVAGTGSCVYGFEGAKNASIGGWGSFIGDEGSGFHVGRECIAASIQDHDGWGPATLMRPLLLKAWGMTSMSELVHHVYSSDWRSMIASAAPVASQAARAGDISAIQIFENAGRQLALQTTALLTKNSLSANLPITTAGSVWKGHPAMLQSFRSVLAARYPETPVIEPIFEPVVGGVVLQAITSLSHIDAIMVDRLKNEYAAFCTNY